MCNAPTAEVLLATTFPESFFRHPHLYRLLAHIGLIMAIKGPFLASLLLFSLCLLLLPVQGQLNNDKSFFLLDGLRPGNLTVISINQKSYDLIAPPFSTNIPIQALTDIVNARFLILSGLDLGTNGIKYTVRISPIFHPHFTCLHLIYTMLVHLFPSMT